MQYSEACLDVSNAPILGQPMRQLSRPIAKSEMASVACDYWSFHILDEIDGGIVRYESLLAAMPIARNILANRLADLRKLDLIARDKCAGDGRCFNYRITDQGQRLLPIIEALRKWEGWDGRLSEAIERREVQ